MTDESVNNGRSAETGLFQSGNSGRKPGSRNRRTVFLEQMLEGDAEKIAKAVIKAAQNGDMQAARLVLDRCYPAPKGRFVEFDMPEMKTVDDLIPAYSAITTAISDGHITVEEGATLAGIIELRRKAIETAELAKRIDVLERNQK